MQSIRSAHLLGRVLAILAAITVLLSVAFAASTPHIIYSFAGGSDGEYLDTDLVMDSLGNLYGTSVQGGDFASGTVWQLSPSASGWIHTVLYSFRGGADGGEPYKGAALDNQGNLYGTAVTGGGGSCEGGCGVVWKLTRSGTLYGMTPTGGANGQGVIFEMKPTRNGTWHFTVIHAFTGGNDGSGGSAGRLLRHKGSLYGVTTTGGANGKGVVFRLTRSAGVWQLTTLYAFRGQPDAGFPYGGLAFDSAGNLYGTTYYDGANNLGSVYRLTPQTDGTWTEVVLYSFKGGRDGSGSISNVVFSKTGNIYGTTSAGGASCDCGTIFKLTATADGRWKESIVYRFHGAPDGAFAYNGMVGDGAGNFYGTTVHGGPTDDGVIYKFTP